MKALSFFTSLILFSLSVSATRYSPPPPGFDFWRSAKELGQRAIDYGNKELAAASRKYTDVAEKIEEFKHAIDALGDGVREFGNGISSKIALNSEEISRNLSKALEDILEQSKEEFEKPLPEDQTESYKAREIAVERALVKIENALVKVLESVGVLELEIREKFTLLGPNIKHVILVTGNLADHHPFLVETLLTAGIFILIPEGWLIKPLLGFFGFGPSGVAKGSVAAQAQRYFFRTTISEGSWFAKLQSAAMKGSSYNWWGVGFFMGIIAWILGGCR